MLKWSYDALNTHEVEIKKKRQVEDDANWEEDENAGKYKDIMNENKPRGRVELVENDYDPPPLRNKKR